MSSADARSEHHLQDLLMQVVEVSRQLGNEAFKAGRYAEAVEHYNQALAGSPKDAKLYRNRSAAYSSLKRQSEALKDAQTALRLQPRWPKAHYRLGMVYAEALDWHNAATVLEAGLSLDPLNHELARLRQAILVQGPTAGAIAECNTVTLSLQERKALEAREEANYEAQCVQAQTAVEQRTLIATLRKARREAIRSNMEKQFRESMIAPDWELEDYEWRPTFFPSSLLEPNSSPQPHYSNTLMLQELTNVLQDLSNPKAACEMLHDRIRLEAWSAAISSAVERNPDSHALVLGQGTGILGLMTAKAGARRVSCIERSRMLYRMARQAIHAHSDYPWWPSITLYCHPLDACSVKGEAVQSGSPISQAAAQATRDTSGVEAHCRDSSGGTSSPRARSQEPEEPQRIHQSKTNLLPERAKIIVTDLLDHSCLGLGILDVLMYAKSNLLMPDAIVVPSALRIKVAALDMQLGPISGFDLSALNKYNWHPGFQRLDLSRESFRLLSDPIEVQSLDLQEFVNSEQQQPDSLKKLKFCHVPLKQGGSCNAVACWFEVNTFGDTWISSWDYKTVLPSATSWQQAIQYFDPVPVQKDGYILLSVHYISGQLQLSCVQAGKGRPRHSSIPRWHFHMVRDAERNCAYETAIQRAIELQQSRRPRDVHVLDMGAGTGLLSMMAARAGAAHVTGAEMSQHMCDVAAETVVRNGCGLSCTMINKDVRRLTVAADTAIAADMARKADICIFEVFDSGLIGEGVLHMLKYASASLLAKDAILVPMAAELWCQPLHYVLDDVCGFDISSCSAWQWRAEYEGIGIMSCGQPWRALSAPVKFMAIDFYAAEHNMEGTEIPFTFTAELDGCCNAIAFWFNLQLDEQTWLTSGPSAQKGLTWEQALQWLPAKTVHAGSPYTIVASHDTYSVSFAHAGCAEQQADVDEVWQQVYGQAVGAYSQLAQACVRNPLTFRATCITALQSLSQKNAPGQAQAAALCLKLLS